MLKRTDTHVAIDVRAPARLRPLRAAPPDWATAFATTDPDRWLHVVEAIADAETLSASALETAVARAYGRLAHALRRASRHPVRFWNFVPGIHADLGDGLDRYMAFNAGRFAAFRDWFGSEATFNKEVPTASAVGVGSGPLVIHGLACAEPGSPVENPRQIPAYSYSRRYGPLPPCFARATRLAPVAIQPGTLGELLLVGGTASIVGEDSQHECNVRQQAIETFDNLARLVTRARETVPPSEPRADPLHAFTNLRVYVVREADLSLLRELVSARFSRDANVEYAQADLCRRELLVEIEGIATL